jgi:choline-sulfatase
VPTPKGVNAPHIIERARRARAQYFGRVLLIDHYVGKIVATLERKGIVENTLIVFTADHGDNIGDYGIFDKRYFYEQSVGVPLIMAGPGLTLNPRLGGCICRALVSGVDLYPTFLHGAGISDRHGKASRDGLSLLDMANDTLDGGLRDAVFSELGTLMMIRDANWKLVYDAEQGGVQYLFNLRRDPEELENLAGCAGYEAVEKRYVERLLSRLIRMTHFTQQKERQRLQRVRV